MLSQGMAVADQVSSRNQLLPDFVTQIYSTDSHFVFMTN